MKYEWTAKAVSDLQTLTAEFDHPRAAARVTRRLTIAPDVLIQFPRMGTLLPVFSPREVRRSLNDHVREMLRELAVTVREVAAQAMDAKRKGVNGLLNALRVKGKQEAAEQARRAAEARRREEERKEALRQQALRESRERAVREAKERMADIAKRAQRLPPDAREQFLAGEYPSNPFDRALKAHNHPLGTAGLDAEEKTVRAHLKVYQEQGKRQQTERQQVPVRGRGRGRGGPSRSRSMDYDSGPSFDPF